MKKIDMFNHFFPKNFFDRYINVSGAKDIGERMLNVRSIVDLEERFRIMDEFGDYCQIISAGQPPIEVMALPDKAPELARVYNDCAAELVAKYPARFPGFVASLPMNNPAEAVKEMERARTQLGAKGFQIFTNVAGKSLDEPEFLPVFEQAALHDSLLWLHPARGANFPDYLAEKKSLYEIWWTLGWPYETSAAMARIVFSGLLDRFPNLKILTHHLGGMIPYFEGRVGYGWDQIGTRTSDADYFALLRSLKKRPLDYFRMFYADSAVFGSTPATECGLKFFGVEHVLFASDAPFDPKPGVYARETIRIIENLDLSTAEKEQIFHGNAERLLKLGQPAASAQK